MKRVITILYMLAGLLLIGSCDKKNSGLETPLSNDAFPQVILLADEGDGDLEDEDKFSFKITLADRKDPKGDELGGTIVPLKQDVAVQFAITGFEGFAQLQDYILDTEAFYEVDDCTTAPVNLQFNAANGTGTVTFPAGVEEVEIEFEVNDALFDDNVFNADERSVTIQLTGITPSNQQVTVNKTAEFVYSVQTMKAFTESGNWMLQIRFNFKNSKICLG